MRTLYRISALVLGVALGAALAQPALAQEGPNITVTGEGYVFAAPDMATITLGVMHRDKNAKAAMDAVSEGVGAILDRLKGVGIDARDVQTSDLSLGPVWNNGSSINPPEISGFEASNRLTVRVRDLDQLGVILEAALEDGANQLSGLSFGLQEPRPLEDEARRRAVADALAKASLYAEAAGVSLGAVLSISENGGIRPEPMMMRDVAAEAVPVAAGETALSAHVSVVFAIGQ